MAYWPSKPPSPPPLSVSVPPCPFCGYRDPLADRVALHIFREHPEDGEPPPFVLDDDDVPEQPRLINNNGDPINNGDPFNGFSPLDFDLDAFTAAAIEAEEESTFVHCPEDGCEEEILLLDLQNHLDLHAAEQISMEDAQRGLDFEKAKRQKREKSRSTYGGDYAVVPGRRSQSPGIDARKRKEPQVSFIPGRTDGSAKKGWRATLSGIATPSGRGRGEISHSRAVVHTDGKMLGKSNLGPYASERQMPVWLYDELSRGGKLIKTQKIDPTTGRLYVTVEVANETQELVPLIALLCERDRFVQKAWLCHPHVRHVGKQHRKEGGFCGYRNIQMVISYIQSAYPRGSHPFEGRIPTIPHIQDLIEQGWDKGINVHGRRETGGIKGTRKYIGTSEAQTLFVSVGIRCTPHAFGRTTGLQTQHNLIAFVEEYFESGAEPGYSEGKVTRTKKPPIYFQHSGHSMTIIGCERNVDGTASLLVFDPFFTPAEPMKRLTGRRSLDGLSVDPATLLRAHRRRMDYLKKYKEFELIIITDPEERRWPGPVVDH